MAFAPNAMTSLLGGRNVGSVGKSLLPSSAVQPSAGISGFAGLAVAAALRIRERNNAAAQAGAGRSFGVDTRDDRGKNLLPPSFEAIKSTPAGGRLTGGGSSASAPTEARNSNSKGDKARKAAEQNKSNAPKATNVTIGGYTSFTDMVDGGGAGKSGDKFEGGISKVSNKVATPYKPKSNDNSRGDKDRKKAEQTKTSTVGKSTTKSGKTTVKAKPKYI